MRLTAEIHKEWIMCLQFCHSSLVQIVKVADKAQTSISQVTLLIPIYLQSCMATSVHIADREHNTE